MNAFMNFLKINANPLSTVPHFRKLVLLINQQLNQEASNLILNKIKLMDETL